MVRGATRVKCEEVESLFIVLVESNQFAANSRDDIPARLFPFAAFARESVVAQ